MRWRKPKAAPGETSLEFDPSTDQDSTDAEAPADVSYVDVGARRRRRQAGAVVGLAVLSAGIGIGIGARLKSPADRAADREPPAASRITVGVEQRALAASVSLTGTIEYEEPIRVRLAGPVGESAGSTQVITRAPVLDAEMSEGMVVAEISGRPVFVLQGILPVFRSLEPGVSGPDVQQLEAALERLGFAPGAVDEIYDDATEAAIDALYAAAGYDSEGPTEEQRKALRASEKSVVDAEQALAEARDALSKGGVTMTSAEKLRVQQELQDAKDNVPAAETAARQANEAAAAKVTTATGLRDAAKVQRDSAATVLAAAKAAGAIDPDTGVEFTPVRIAELEAALATEEAELLAAEQELRDEVGIQTSTTASGNKSVADAKDALALAQAVYNDAQKPADTRTLQDAVTAQQAVLDQARLELSEVERESGTKVPAGELVFAPSLPSTITSVNPSAVPGAAVPTDELLTLSDVDTRVTARISRSDANLVRAGMPVDIVIRDLNIETTGIIDRVGEPPAEAPSDDEFSGDQGSGDSGRLEVVVLPDDPAVLRDWVGERARILAAVSSTNGEVLAVPMAAVFVGPDGESQVEVERTPATRDDPGTTEVIGVKVGLTAQGYAEITPIAGSLAAGDRVVVGTESAADPDAADEDSSENDSSE